MKNIIFALGIVLIALPVYAENESVHFMGDNACAIYDSLTIEASLQGYDDGVIIMPGDLPQQTYEKNLPGLYCKSTVEKKIVERRTCDCSFEENLTNEEMAEIYYSLSSEEKFIGGTDVKVFNKTVGTMFFTRKVFQLNDKEYITNYQFSVLYY